MNIFCTSPDPLICVQHLDDSRVTKMVLESAMMLSDAIHHLIPNFEYKDKICYKNRQINNPWIIWTRQNKSNFTWMLDYFKCLLDEFFERRDKVHKYQDMLPFLEAALDRIPQGTLTPFPNQCYKPTKNIDFRHIKNVHEAYKLYLNEKWKTDIRKPIWTGKLKPEFHLTN